MPELKVMRKFKTRYTALFVLIVPYLWINLVGCSPSAKLQVEFIRPDSGASYLELFDTYRKLIPAKLKEDKIPGLSITIVDREGIVWTAGFGQTGRGNQPVTPDTLFSIQSMSKTFTATAVMMALQDGLVDLDTPITHYLPYFTVNSHFEEKPQEKITLRHLLSHTSGLPHEASVGNNFDIQCDSFEQHIKSISDTWLKCRVGERYDYSNLGFDLASYILQVRSEIPFAVYMKTKIFDPLGMASSSVDYETIKRYSNRALGHMPFIRETPIKIPMTGAAGVFTSAKELSRFMQFHLNRGQIEGHRLLDEALVDTMYTSSPVSNTYGLGIEIIEKHNTYYLKHDGGGFGFLTIMAWYPEYGIGCIVLTNAQDRNLHFNISNDILDSLIERKIVTKNIEFKFPDANHLLGKDTKLPLLPKIDSIYTPSPYQSQWKPYIGTYRFIFTNYKPDFLFRIAMATGYCHPYVKVMVYEKDDYLWIGTDKDGYRSTGHEKLEQILPGLFIAPSGETLDFRGPMPRWKNIRMEKICNPI